MIRKKEEKQLELDQEEKGLHMKMLLENDWKEERQQEMNKRRLKHDLEEKGLQEMDKGRKELVALRVGYPILRRGVVEFVSTWSSTRRASWTRSRRTRSVTTWATLSPSYSMPKNQKEKKEKKNKSEP